MRVKAVLFDLFDTLVLIEHGDAFYAPSLRRLHEFLVKNEVDVSFQEFKRAYYDARDNLYAKTADNLEEPHFNLRVSNALRILGYDFEAFGTVVCGASAAFCREFMRHLRLDENALEVLEKLRGKCKLGLVSNFAIPECVSELMNQFGLEGFFDSIVISGAINNRKPSAEIFERALEEIGVDASETVFVGDTLDVDVKGAQNVGMKTVLIDRRPQKKAESVCPDQTIKNLNELLTALEQF